MIYLFYFMKEMIEIVENSKKIVAYSKLLIIKTLRFRMAVFDWLPERGNENINYLYAPSKLNPQPSCLQSHACSPVPQRPTSHFIFQILN